MICCGGVKRSAACCAFDCHRRARGGMNERRGVRSDVYKVVEWKETKVKMICTGVWPRRRTTQPVKLIRT